MILLKLYIAKLITDYPTKRIILMGDSAGGGLAFGFVQQLRNENKKQPEQIIIFSPWLDVTMNNPNIELIEKEDKMLSIKGLKNAGQKYAGNLRLKRLPGKPDIWRLNRIVQNINFYRNKRHIKCRCSKMQTANERSTRSALTILSIQKCFMIG